MTQPVIHDGVSYPSQAGLARAMGLAPSTVSAAVRSGLLHTLGKGSAVGVHAAAQARSRPLAAAGLTWSSHAACARDLGVVHCVVHRAVAANRFEAWAEGRLRKLGRIAGDPPQRADAYAFPPGSFACGHGFCPAVLRLLWPENAIRIGDIAGLTRVTPATIWTRVERLGLYDPRAHRLKPRYTPGAFRALWADQNLSLAEIGARLGGMHPVNVTQHAARMGLSPRKTGRKPKIVIGADFDLMWWMGVKVRDIARAHGMCQAHASRLALSRGLPPRDRPGRHGKLTLEQFRDWQLGQALARSAAETTAALRLSGMVDVVRPARAA
jgi:hypothetical protein